jgi:hypothetical protein
MLAVFGIDYPRASWDEITAYIDCSPRIKERIRRKLSGRKSLEIRERDMNFDPDLLEHDPAYLTGYFQTWKYFDDIEAEVRKAFTFPERASMDLPAELDQRIGTYQYMIEHTEAISVHFRRGDYLYTEDVYGELCTEAYYEAAMTYMKKKYPNAVFYVFSNEIKWVKSWLENRYLIPGEEELSAEFCLIEETTEHTGYLDMMLMGKCKHHIIANSSFSWWAAYLNDSSEKTVIAPDKWNNKRDFIDIYTENMLRITAEGRIA